MAPPTGVVDPGWEHGVAVDDRKKKVKCNYCGKIVSGGIYRLKQHLARVSGEVTYCDNSPEDVSLRMKQILQQRCRSSSATRKHHHHHPEDNNNNNNNNNYNGNGLSHHDDDDDDEEEERRSRKGKKQCFSLVRSSSGYVDPGWEHGVAQDERKKKVKCNYCGKIVSGGINRFKQHLARIPGEVAPCKAAPEEVYAKIKENMKWHRAGKRHNVPDDGRALTDLDQEEEEEYGRYSSKEKRRRSFDSTNNTRPKRVKGNSFPSSSRYTTGCVSRREVTSSISKFFHHVGVPTEAANSLYFRNMVELIGLYGEGYVVPSSSHGSSRLLHDEITTIKGHLREYRSSWIVTGCSILADTWTNAEGKTMMSLLVSSPRGVYFHSSIDATDVIAEDSLSLFKYLDKLVEDIGEENVVQVITQNTGVCRTAGKLLEEKRKNLYWSPCAMHSTELVLEDISKLEYVSECLEKSQRITRLIYNQTWLLNLMKSEFTQGTDLLRQETTRHASSFATLQALMDHKANLRALFQSNSWILSQTAAAKSEEGREVEKIVSSAAFWKKVQYVLKSVDPVMQVMRMVGGERLSLPYAYGYMCRAKMAIKSVHGDDARKYGPFWRVIDYHWNSLFHHPLYVAAYFFNPAYRYRSDFMAHSEVVRGVNECIVRLEPDNARRITALMQIPDYTSAKGDFGTEIAIGTRTELDPAAWWQQHGISCLELQRVAVRILSHTCCSVGCEPKWSVYDQVNGECQSRFARKSRRDAAYVHYNLRLREKQLKRRMHDDDDEGPPPSSLNYVLLDRLLPDWLVTCEKEEEEDRDVEDEEEEEEENCYDDSVNVYGDGEENVDVVYNDDLSEDD